MSEQNFLYLVGTFNAGASGLNAAVYASSHWSVSLGVAVASGLYSLGIYMRLATA